MKSKFLDLGHFKLDKLISKRDYCKIYKVLSLDTEMIYSAKISTIKMNKFSRDELINLSREINLISQLHHPTFLKFIGYSPTDFKHKRHPVIITELSKNGTLKNLLDILRENKEIKEWDSTTKLINIYGIASGMSYLHSNNIIHRDLNPMNIFLDDYFFPKIGDFGLSKREHKSDTLTYQSTAGMKGNPTYSSPEILQFNDYSKSGDVYSFGFIVFEIMTNEIPFAGITNNNEIYNEVVLKCHRPNLSEKIPDVYRQLIESCWNQNQSERPTFDKIIEFLEKDERFITEDVNLQYFKKYVKFIEESIKSFDSSKKCFNIDNIILAKSKIEETSNKDSLSDSSNLSEDENETLITNSKNVSEAVNNCTRTIDKNNNSTINNQNKLEELNNKIITERETKHIEPTPNQTENLFEKKQASTISAHNEQTKSVEENHQRKTIERLILSNQPIELMHFLYHNCDNETISSVFDHLSQHQSEIFYQTVLNEGISCNNPVSHYKYSLFLLFDQQKESQNEYIIAEVQKHLKISASLGYSKSYFMLSPLSHEIIHDDSSSFNYAREGSENGDCYSKCLLGHFIYRGIGTESNKLLGFKLMIESGANELIDIFSTEIGIGYYMKSLESKEKHEEFKRKSFEYFKKAFENKKTTATINNYAICFILGNGVSKDIEKAKEILEEGIKIKDSNSKFILKCLQSKSGITRSFVEE